MKKIITSLLVLALAGWLGWQIYQRLQQEQAASGNNRERGALVVPVEVGEAIRGSIDQIRSFTGTLDAHREFVIASKVSGRIEEIAVELADTVARGQMVARLDNDEYLQAVTQAEADLAVARANLAEANSLLEISMRELERVETLRTRGVSSDSERDTAKANQLARAAHLQVTQAQVTRANATLETARIRLGYSNVVASWSGGNDRRVVAERFVDEGETVAANEPLLRIVELEQVTAVFHVTERDYGLLQTEQTVQLETDAYPGEQFDGTISRIAPVFRENTRQARVELRVDNPDLRLKPGMFARIRVRLAREPDAIIVPRQALVVRGGETGVFIVDAAGSSVRWQQVKTGIQQDDRVQVITAEIDGPVVILGQQLLDDGSAVTVAEGSTL